MSGLFGHCAIVIVIGAGIGGLSIAGALAKYFEQVEVFERDRLTASAAHGPALPRIGTHMVCSPVAFGR